jgi:hypothetical protein
MGPHPGFTMPLKFYGPKILWSKGPTIQHNRPPIPMHVKSARRAGFWVVNK